MKKLMHILMLSCRKATLLVEKGHARSLSFAEKVQLQMHLSMCSKCSQFRKQSLLIENILKSNHKIFPDPTELQLSPESKSQIQRNIDQNLKKD